MGVRYPVDAMALAAARDDVTEAHRALTAAGVPEKLNGFPMKLRTRIDILAERAGVAAGPQATPDQVLALRQLHEAATPAPWEAGPDRRSNATVVAPSKEADGLLAEVALCPWQPDGGQHVDALLIAAMRNALPQLLGRVVAVPTDQEPEDG